MKKLFLFLFAYSLALNVSGQIDSLSIVVSDTEQGQGTVFSIAEIIVVTSCALVEDSNNISCYFPISNTKFNIESNVTEDLYSDMILLKVSVPKRPAIKLAETQGSKIHIVGFA